MASDNFCLTSREKLINSSGHHHTFHVPLGDVLYFTNWQYNRNPDPVRVRSIVNSIKKGEYVLEHICVASINGGIEIYDGMHRYTAWLECLKSGILGNNFGIIVNCLIAKDDREIKNCFANINKSVSVPGSYIDALFRPAVENIRDKINTLVKEYCNDYAKFTSSSKICQRPNFNRDILEDNLYDLYNKLTESHQMTFDEMKKCLINLNIRYYKLCETRKTKPQKCIDEGFYLFVDSRTINSIHMLDELIKLREHI